MPDGSRIVSIDENSVEERLQPSQALIQDSHSRSNRLDARVLGWEEGAEAGED
ncbi:MAG: hypothetical protein VST66_00870 [Nitrospirota bacterium]|nr:hypothetical protein [Nitrospirota bacterium]